MGFVDVYTGANPEIAWKGRKERHDWVTILDCYRLELVPSKSEKKRKGQKHVIYV